MTSSTRFLCGLKKLETHLDFNRLKLKSNRNQLILRSSQKCLKEILEKRPLKNKKKGRLHLTSQKFIHYPQFSKRKNKKYLILLQTEDVP